MIELIETNQIVLNLSGGYMMHLETTWNVSHVTCHWTAFPKLSELETCNLHMYSLYPMCHVSHVMCHIFLFFTKWLSWFVKALFETFSYYKRTGTEYLLISACSGPFWVTKNSKFIRILDRL